MNIIQRISSPTPGFFQKLRNIGIVLAAIGGAIITAPVALPAVVVTVAGYLAVAGTVIGAVSQLTVSNNGKGGSDG
jgi:ABC-type xylose transport system permease subunit